MLKTSRENNASHLIYEKLKKDEQVFLCTDRLVLVPC